MTRSRRFSPWRDPVALLALPAVIYLAGRLRLPLLWLLLKSSPAPGLTLQPYVAFLTTRSTGGSSATPARRGLGHAWSASCSAIPPPSRWRAPARSLQIVMLVSIILPLSIGAVVKAFAWQIVLRRDGVVSQLWSGSASWDEPQRLLFTETGLVLGAANIFLPFMILPIYSVVKLIDPRLREAGATLGATPLYRFTQVTLPLTLPGVVSGIAFVFSMSVSMFVIPSLLIGDRFQTLSTLTGRSFLFMRNEQLGSTTAVILLALAVNVVVGSSWLARRLGARDDGHRAARAALHVVGRGHYGGVPDDAAPGDGRRLPRLVRHLYPAAALVVAALVREARHDPRPVAFAADLALSRSWPSRPCWRWCSERSAPSRGGAAASPAARSIATFLVSPLMLPGLVVGIAMLQGFKALGPARGFFEPADRACGDHAALRRAHRAGGAVAVRLLADRRRPHPGLFLPAALMRVLVPALGRRS